MILFTASGTDTPGITSALTGILAHRNARIVDLTQAVIQNLLTLSILFDASSAEDQNKCLQELTAKAESLHLRVAFEIDHQPSPASKAARNKAVLTHYAVTLIADSISAQALHEVTEALAKRRYNIDAMKRLSEGSFSCVEMIVSGDAPQSESASNLTVTGSPANIQENLKMKEMKAELLTIAQKLKVDIALQAEGLYRRAKRLVVFDMDSTLIQGEVIDQLARQKGVYDEVAAITHSAMNGQMDFNESLRQRVSKLKGLTQSDLDQVFKRIELTPGAEDLIRVLKKLGYKIALISGGFTFVADQLKTRLGLDHVYANKLELQNGTLTGKTIPPIVNAQRKADLLGEIAHHEKIELDQVIAIGDGANDLPMLEKAGLGIAFNAKETVREKADLSINQRNLRSVLYLLGLSEKDLDVCLSPKG